MKFSNGYWQTKEGMTVQCPMDIRDVAVAADSLTVYAATRKIERKGDTLNGALLTVTFSAPLPDVIRVRIVHHEGKKRSGPEFPLNERKETPVDITNGERTAELASGRLSVRVGKSDGWNVDFLYDGKRLTGSGHKGPAYVRSADKTVYMREQLSLGVGEYVYGLGERFTPFVKNGQVVDIWNEDGGTCSEQAYKNVPFYLSNRGYGVFVNHPGRVSYEIGSEVVSKVQFSVEGEELDYFVIGGATAKDVLERYTELCGKPALPPAWSFGLWLTTSFTTNYDEATVGQMIDGMRQRDLPLRVFHFDCFWMKEYQWCDFEWDRNVFPDPEAMLRRLKDKGLNICVWINPYIAQKSPLFREGMENGYLLRTPQGDVWQWDMWQAGMALVDFTNPEAVRWFQSKLERLVDMGVDCFKTDFGERIPTDVVYHDGSDPVKMHNYYTQLYNKAVFELLERKRGKGEAMLFARSATVGGQQYPVHWGGDCSSTYDSMAETLRGGLSLGLSGFGFWSHDISGFERTATPDLYKRWVAFGMLSSHSRLHGNQSYRVPWLFDEEAVDVLRFFTKLKCRLMPYLYGAAHEAAKRGLPMMRAMMLEFPGDPACEQLDRQYMLGESLLVAPIFSEDGEAVCYVPEGRWTHLLSGATVEGGRWLREKHDYFSLPLLVRPGSLIAFGHDDTRPDYDYAEGVELHLFELEDGGTATAVVRNTQGEVELTVTARRNGAELTVSADGAGKCWEVVLRGIAELSSAEGAKWHREPPGVRLRPLGGMTEIKATLPIRPSS